MPVLGVNGGVIRVGDVVIDTKVSPADRLVAAAERAAGCNLAVTGAELERPAATGGARLLCGCGLT